MKDKEQPPDTAGEESAPLNPSTEAAQPAPVPAPSCPEGTQTPVSPDTDKGTGMETGSADRVVAPVAEGEKVDDSELCDVDLEGGAPIHAAPTNGVSTGKEDNTAPGKDETDNMSVYSYYMESDFRYYFQHPFVRLFLVYFVTFCNFLIYAEDPVAHSRAECNIPVIGNCFAFVCMQYAPNAWSLLKVFLWLAAIVVGMLVGKILIHTRLFNGLFRLKMFHDDKGSWMTMFLTTIVVEFIFSYVYNVFLLIGGDSTLEYRISPYMSIPNHVFMKAAATGTWCGDFFTAWMVTDMMLQERLYPMWAKRPRQWWNTGYRRIVLFWIIVFTSSFIVIFVIATDYINWDSLNRDFLHTNELSRAILASFILVMDILIVMQDWDFPHFVGAIDLKLPGINKAHIRFKIPQLLRKLEYWHVHISGKWFNYGILFIVIILDLNMWKNQIFYAPFDFGQYVDPEGRIHSVNDPYSLGNFNESMMTFTYRNNTIDPITGLRYIELDTVMNARYNGYPLGLKAMAFVPSIGIFIAFGILVWIYGRMPKPTKADPYAGRLKKRKKRRFTMRIGWKRLRKRFHTNPILFTGFQCVRGAAGTEEEKEKAMAERVVRLWKEEAKNGNGDDQGDLVEHHKDGENVKVEIV